MGFKIMGDDHASITIEFEMFIELVKHIDQYIHISQEKVSVREPNT